MAYILSPQGHLAHVFGAIDDGTTLWCHTEPGRLPELLAWLGKMIFAARVELAEPDGFVLAMAPGAAPEVIPAGRLEDTLGPVRAGTWAMDALRIAAGLPRIFVDTDERTIPMSWPTPTATCSARPSICARAATRARRRWPGSTTWAGRRVG